MDFEVTVHMLLPLVTGQSARGEWKKQEVIFDLPGEFNRKLCVGFWNDRAVDAAALRPGDRVALSVNIESREYNGRWYTEVRAWRMNRLEVQAGAPMQSSAGAYPSPYPPQGAMPTGGQQQQSYGAGQQQGASAAGGSAPTSAAEVDDLPF
ncbi:DUF3127 domain-containing protein [uncultured Rikenella sp.]|uniref:DUF3127 domain-containing protein n=1 Tax=uncultured Rikenella sp. TaxID=368003 RepID=UPI002617BD7F|nr:DUF3127 domain-containing protein [uncultured Rikenella sp.]